MIVEIRFLLFPLLFLRVTYHSFELLVHLELRKFLIKVNTIHVHKTI